MSVRRVPKPWGEEIIYAHTERYAGKILMIRGGESLSLQYHERKDESIYLLRGSMRLVLQDGAGGPREETILKAGDAEHLPPLKRHRMEALSDCVVLEVSTPELDDVVRLEDRYGRA
ncbi:MAG TPA: cupin domain-containing protein [Candidatus Dormibacteraeota bacterium]|nr:cupin domain-containing protein [Candidatus Dormibacteraeota bacterium]